MKWTASSLVAMFGMMVGIYAMWPAMAWQKSSPPRLVAQESRANRQKGEARSRPEKKPADEVDPSQSDGPRRNAISKKLMQRMDAVFPDAPLQDVLDALSGQWDVNFVIDRKALEEEGIGTDKAVHVSLKEVKVETVLDLVLSELDLVWIVRDEYVLVTTPSKLDSLLEVRVYNCRDLIGPVMFSALSGGPMSEGGGGLMPGAAGMPGGMMGGAPSSAMGMPGMGMPGVGMPGRGMPGMDGGMGTEMAGAMTGMSGAMHPGSAEAPSAAEALIKVIITTVMPETWSEAGGVGSISAFHGGLLVVNHHPNGHKKIEQLLTMLRQVSKEKPGSVAGQK